MHKWYSLIDGSPELPYDVPVETTGAYSDGRIVLDCFHSVTKTWMLQPGTPTHWRPRCNAPKENDNNGLVKNATKEIYFGIGLPKTGLSSLTKAFKLLGFYSGQYMPNKWLNDIYKFDFVNDLPITSRYESLSVTYPNSKFIFTTRDMNKWLDSCKRHWARRTNYSRPVIDRLFETYGSIKFDEESFKIIYDQHRQSVETYFKDTDRLLVLDICGGEGWDELCPFIGKSIPIMTFPRKNVFKKRKQEILGGYSVNIVAG